MINWQTRATKFAEKHNLTRLPGVYALDLLSELGEALYSLCLLAHAAGIDLEKAFTVTPAK